MGKAYPKAVLCAVSWASVVFEGGVEHGIFQHGSLCGCGVIVVIPEPFHRRNAPVPVAEYDGWCILVSRKAKASFRVGLVTEFQERQTEEQVLDSE